MKNINQNIFFSTSTLRFNVILNNTKQYSIFGCKLLVLLRVIILLSSLKNQHTLFFFCVHKFYNN